MFSEKLKQAMLEKGMSRTALSAATGIGKSSISQYLSGKNEPPDKKKVVIAEALGLAPDYFKQTAVGDSVTTETRKLSPMTAARLMGKSKEFIYQGLRNGTFPWGYGVKMGKNWSYFISSVKFTECTGIEVPLNEIA